MVRLVFFLLQGKVLCFDTRREVSCEMFITYCLKRSEDLIENIISPVIFDTDHSFKR